MRKRTADHPLTPNVAIVARSYGWKVIPCRDDGSPANGLIPLGLTDRRADEDEIRRWFDRDPHTNIGLHLGWHSGCVALTLDFRLAGRDGQTPLRQLHEEFPSTPTFTIGDGCQALLFLNPGGNCRVGTGGDLDGIRGVTLLGDAETIALPPSRLRNGARLAWVKDRGPDNIDLAPLPRRFGHCWENLVARTPTDYDELPQSRRPR
jgi:hypothetical protein